MKLAELKENSGYGSSQMYTAEERQRYSEMLHQQLEKGGFGPVIDKVLDRLSEIQWETLIRHQSLIDAAVDSYDHADDSGESIGVSARDIAKALIDLGLEDK